jgi:AcrR family transcriptional regulator
MDGDGSRAGTGPDGRCPGVIDRSVKEQHHWRIMVEDRRLTTQGLERKQQLLDCAAELFAERGYNETRVIDIVKAAGVAKGLFYWYFENKEALFRELLTLNRQRLRQAQAEAIDPSGEPLLQIRQGAEGSLAFMSRQANFFALLELENIGQQFGDVLRKGNEIHLADTTALVKQGIVDGSIRDENPDLLALGVLGNVGYYAHFHRVGRIRQPVEQLAGFVGRFIVCSLAADETVARRVLAVPPHPAAG